MWMIKLFLMLLAVCSIANCVPTFISEFSRAESNFAWDLHEQVVNSKPGNVIISPLSVTTLLALLSQAADGLTYIELQNGLHLNGTDKITVASQYHQFANQLKRDIGSAQFNLANQIYVQQGHHLNRKFENLAETKFGSGVKTLNFCDAVKSAEIINHYVAEKTHAKINELVKFDSLNADTATFLVNAIYFKGKWAHPFNKKWTHTGPFHTNDKQPIWTEFMQLEHKLNVVHSAELQASLIELKYADSKLSFVVALPHKSSNLQELVTKIKHSHLTNILNQMRPEKMVLTLPKFKVEFEIELNDVLKQLHMGRILSCNANLRGLLDESDMKKVFISKIIHKAVIGIDELGSEASGSTGGEVITTNSLMKFNIDSPFMYFIRDTETNTIIFSGRIETVDGK